MSVLYPDFKVECSERLVNLLAMHPTDERTSCKVNCFNHTDCFQFQPSVLLLENAKKVLQGAMLITVAKVEALMLEKLFKL